LVLPSGFSSYNSVLISHTSRSQNILIYLIILKLPLYYRAYPITRLSTKSPVATMDITIRITTHVTALTWRDSSLFWNQLGT